MSILLWNIIEMEYKIHCLHFFWLFTNGRQEIDPQRVKPITNFNVKKFISEFSEAFITSNQ